jgi:hypothetical protein
MKTMGVDAVTSTPWTSRQRPIVDMFIDAAIRSSSAIR